MTIDKHLTFKKHKEDIIAKGKKRAAFLSSLSNKKWGIPPRLFKMLITSTVHAAIDYAAAAWINLPIPQYFTKKLTKIDTICATKALGALENSPHIFLRHDLNLQPPNIRLTAKIINTVALIASQPHTHPLYHVYQHARKTRPQAHKGPSHAYFTSLSLTALKILQTYNSRTRPSHWNPPQTLLPSSSPTRLRPSSPLKP